MRRLCMRALWMVVFVLTAALPRDAEATPFVGGKEALGIFGAMAVIAAVVMPIGAMVTTLDGEPDEVWARGSLVLGGITTLVGIPLMVVAEDKDDTTLYVLGSVALTMGVNGLFWGGASEATLPEGPERRPRGTFTQSPTGLVVRGRF